MAGGSRRTAKRSRQDDDSSDASSDAGPSRNAPAARTKKRRVSDQGDEDDQNYDEQPGPTPPSATAQTATQSAKGKTTRRVVRKIATYESMRNKGFKHLQHQDADDAKAAIQLAERLARKKDLNPINRQAESGIIEKVTCVDFMCHARLEVELGPLLNFIVGQNGSGKSAVLTAITLCLGAKASSTNRGGSLKSFIRNGKKRGYLAVQIKNCGEDAYQPDVYGKSIIVERHFSRAGSSSFKLKSAEGKLISTKRDEVDEMTTYFKFQVDNPLTILSQDNAREFLNGSSAAQKYSFFVRGVNLEEMDKDFQLAKYYADIHTEKITELEGYRDRTRQKYLEVLQLAESIKDNQRLFAQRRVYTNQMAWVQVAEQEEALKDLVAKVDAMGPAMAEAEDRKQACAQKLDLESEKVRRAEEALEEHKVKEDDLVREAEAEAGKLEAMKLEHQELSADERDIHSQLKTKSNRAKDLLEKVRQEKKRLEDASGDKRREIEARLEAARAKQAEIAQDIARESEGSTDLTANVRAAKSKLESHDAQVQQKRKEVQGHESRVRSLRNSRGSVSIYDGYDRNMPKLVEAIERDRRFAQRPIGPIGAKIRVLKPVWASILEKTFGASLNGFIVVSHADQQVLSSLVKQYNMPSIPIFIASNRPINTEGREPDAQFDTILRALEFDSPVVRDQLIINNYIEQTILVEDRRRAEQVMFSGAPPPNTVACLSLHDKKRNEGLRLATRAGGNYSTSPVVPNLHQKARMRTDMDSQISVHEEALAHAREELAALQSRRQDAKADVDEKLAAQRRNEKRRSVLQTAARAAATQTGDIERELDQFDGADSRLSSYEQQLEQARAEVEQLGRQYGELRVKKEEKFEELTAQKVVVEDVKARLTKLRGLLTRLKASVEKHMDLRRVALVEKNDAHESIAFLLEEKARLEAKRDERRETVEEFTQLASEVSGRVDIPEGETKKMVEEKLSKVDAQIKNRQRQQGITDREVHQKFIRLRTTLHDTENVLRNGKRRIRILTMVLADRMEKWRNFQRWASANARTNFVYLLSERRFRGKLVIDHRKQLLHVHVEPSNSRSATEGRDTSTLSGGEKSFSSICLLLAIWEAMGTPLRCLDEFDVFMDSVNRQVSTTMLIESARRSVGRQYIFITPNSIHTDLEDMSDVRTINMSDPDQTTLDF